MTFHRTALAQQMAKQLLQPTFLDLSLRSGLFLSGQRRVGKTTFLAGDLIPELQALGAIVPALVGMLGAFASQGFAPLQPRFALRDALAGRAVNLSDGSAGLAQGVAADGALPVQTPQGVVSVTSSEISVRPQA